MSVMAGQTAFQNRHSDSRFTQKRRRLRSHHADPARFVPQSSIPADTSRPVGLGVKIDFVREASPST